MVYIINLINSLILIGVGVWGYFASGSGTALIPVAFGVVLLFCTPGLKNENKIISHLAVLITVLVIGALSVNPLGAGLGECGIIKKYAEISDGSNHCDNQTWKLEVELPTLTDEDRKRHTNEDGEFTLDLDKNQDKIINHEDYKMIKSKLNRLYAMIGSSSVALLVFVFSFIRARMQKK